MLPILFYCERNDFLTEIERKMAERQKENAFCIFFFVEANGLFLSKMDRKIEDYQHYHVDNVYKSDNMIKKVAKVHIQRRTKTENNFRSCVVKKSQKGKIISRSIEREANRIRKNASKTFSKNFEKSVDKLKRL